MTEQPPPVGGSQAGAGDPIDRRISDGQAGVGDMLGGSNAGAGDRLGPDQGGEQAGVTLPASGEAPGAAGQTVPMAAVPVEGQADE